MYGKGTKQDFGGWVKGVAQTAYGIGKKVALPLAVMAATAYAPAAIPAFLGAYAVSQQLERAVVPQGVPTTQSSTRNWGNQYNGGNRNLGRGNYSTNIPQRRPQPTG